MICNIEFQIADWIAIFGVLITLILGTSVVNYQSKNRSQKDFFINEIAILKNDYNEFIKKILADQVNSQYIRDQFKLFSDRIKILDEIIKNEYSINSRTKDVFEKHAKLQVEITEFQSVEDQYQQNFVTFSGVEKTRVSDLFNPLHKAFLNLVVTVNNASSIKPWEREDFYNY